MRRFSRTGALVASSALMVAGLTVTTTTAAQAAPEPDPTGQDTAVSWITGQLTNGLLGYAGTVYTDYGSSIDIALQLDQIGGAANTATADQITDALADDIENYVVFGAGAAAKSAVLAQEQGDDATDFGGVDLIDQVENATADSGNSAGRLADISFGTDYTNTLKQAFAARVLEADNSPEASAAIEFLLKQQCSNGGFRLTFNTDTSAMNQSCTDPSTAQLDSTSTAILQLQAMTPTTAINDALNDARDFLADEQQASGAWGGDPDTSAANANSTGLATWALGSSPQAIKGAQWLRDNQATYYDACTGLRSRIGSVAYDAAALASGRSNGIPLGNLDQFRRATSQSLVALGYDQSEYVDAAPVLTGPSGYLKAGSRYNFTVTGVPAGDDLCLNSGFSVSGATASGGTFVRSLVMPYGAAITRTITVRDRNNNADTTTVQVLNPKTLTVTKAKYRVKRKTFATVTVYGLAPGERVSIRFRGVLKATGVADAAGQFRRGIWTGKKLGKGTVVAYGQFGDTRNGSTKLKVRR